MKTLTSYSMIRTIAFLAIFQIFLALSLCAQSELSSQRISEIEATLPEQPVGFGEPYTNRAFWDDPKAVELAKNAVDKASDRLSGAPPEWDDKIYVECAKTGKRVGGDGMVIQRHVWVNPLVFAECLENKGTYVKQINAALEAYTKDPSWTMPAHDPELKNYKGEEYSVDLESSRFASQLASILYLLGDKIEPDVRQHVMKALDQRIFDPVQNSIKAGAKNSKGFYYGNKWLGNKKDPVKNNWNAVCLSGVAGAAMTILPERKDRATFIAAGEHYSQYFINSFRDDGYFDEGVAYWNLAFSNVCILRETILRATQGASDLFSDQKVRDVALFGLKMRMGDSAVPYFGDCPYGTQASDALVNYFSKVFDLEIKNSERTRYLLGGDPNTIFIPPTPYKGNANSSELIGLRSFFEKTVALVSRPASNSECKLGIAIKGGGNSSHSHNDVGSFNVAYDDEVLVGDPGGPYKYNGDTFGPKRYTFKTLNSFGHPVPVIAGELQVDATTIEPKAISTQFTDDEDTLVLDMKDAYALKSLTKFTRTMIYSRKGAGSITIKDEVEFSSPQTFEAALPTRADFKQIDEKTFEFFKNGKAIRMVLETPDGFELTKESVQEFSDPTGFTRLGFKLKQPVTTATVTMTFAPARK